MLSLEIVSLYTEVAYPIHMQSLLSSYQLAGQHWKIQPEFDRRTKCSKIVVPVDRRKLVIIIYYIYGLFLANVLV